MAHLGQKSPRLSRRHDFRVDRGVRSSFVIMQSNLLGVDCALEDVLFNERDRV